MKTQIPEAEDYEVSIKASELYQMYNDADAAQAMCERAKWYVDAIRKLMLMAAMGGFAVGALVVFWIAQ